jgi:hypothetical protein
MLNVKKDKSPRHFIRPEVVTPTNKKFSRTPAGDALSTTKHSMTITPVSQAKWNNAPFGQETGTTVDSTKHSSDYITCLFLCCESYRHDVEAMNVSFIHIISPSIISHDRYFQTCETCFLPCLGSNNFAVVWLWKAKRTLDIQGQNANCRCLQIKVPWKCQALRKIK